MTGIRYADAHFHTATSDNRDRASLEAMVDRFRSAGVGLVSPADHHHNIHPEGWNQLCAGASRLGVKPGVEITFKRGHFVVLGAEGVDGSAMEGYHYLFLDRERTKFVAHPMAWMDSWRDTPLPGFHGMELINGDLFGSLERLGWPVRRYPPTLGTWGTWLDRGIPLAALGSSDAHTLVAPGHGVTGLPADLDLETAIRRRLTFAASDPGVAMTWDLASRSLRWHVDVDGKTAGPVDIYRGSRRIARVHGEGTTSLPGPGLYWLRLRVAGRLGFSSAVVLGNPVPDFTLRPREVDRLRRDFAAYSGTPVDDTAPGSAVISSRRPPEGAKRVSGAGRFLEKTGGPEILDEFRLWLNRGEIHEYVLVGLESRERRGTLQITGEVVPALSVGSPELRTKWQDAHAELSAAAGRLGRVHVSLRHLPRWRVGSNPGQIHDRGLRSRVEVRRATYPDDFEKLYTAAAMEELRQPTAVQVFE